MHFHAGMHESYTKVAGVSYNNDDGSSRQDAIKHSRPGEVLTLTHTPVPEDENGIAITRSNGEQLGWLPRDVAKNIAPRLDAGEDLKARIMEITGGGWGKTRGCNIEIVYGLIDEEIQLADPKGKYSQFKRTLIGCAVLLILLLISLAACWKTLASP